MGEIKDYHENGQLKGEGEHNEFGLKQGIWKEYYENGQLERKINYEDGEGKLIKKLYDEKGKLLIENKYEMYLSSLDEMSGGGNCGIQVFISENDWELYGEDDYYWTTPGGIMELVEYASSEECVMVMRYEIFDREKQIYYEIVEIETFNTNKVYKELNKTYYKKGCLNYPNPVEYNLMNNKEIEKFEYKDDYEGNNRSYGVDFYVLENFDLELELATGH